MLEKKRVLSMLALCLIGLLLTSPSYAQQTQRGQRGQRGQGGGGQGQQRQRGQGEGQQGQRGQRGQGDQRSETRQSETERMQERLGATDQEWKVLGPRVMKVSELSRQLRGGGGGGGRQRGGAQGGRGRQGGDSQNAQTTTRQSTPARAQSAVEKAQQQLRTLLENQSATAAQIRQQITTLRAARTQVRQQLAAAQMELVKIVTARQEAQLIMMGLLE